MSMNWNNLDPAERIIIIAALAIMLFLAWLAFS